MDEFNLQFLIFFYCFLTFNVDWSDFLQKKNEWRFTHFRWNWNKAAAQRGIWRSTEYLSFLHNTIFVFNLNCVGNYLISHIERILLRCCSRWWCHLIACCCWSHIQRDNLSRPQLSIIEHCRSRALAIANRQSQHTTWGGWKKIYWKTRSRLRNGE